MKRPRLISLLCIAGYLSVLLSFPQVFAPSVKKLGIFVPALYGLLVTARFIACVGIWHDKRWGAELYVAAFFARLLFVVLSTQAGLGFYLGLPLSLASVVILFVYYPRMSPEL
jgi:hypothetical protein